MSLINYNNNVGSTSTSNGTNDFLLAGSVTGYTSFSSYSGQYLPYYARTDSIPNEWEYGLGYVSGSILVRSIIYNSSNSNNKVSFSTTDQKTIYSTVNAERLNHGGNSYIYQTGNFTAGNTQAIYGVLANGSSTITGLLPTASGNDNLIIGFRLLNNSTQSLVIDASGSETIDGQLVASISPNEKYLSLVSNGSGWVLLNRSTEIVGSGLPSGIAGSVQYRVSSAALGGDNYFVWDSGSRNLLIGGSGTGVANVILPGTGTQNTIFNNLSFNANFLVKGTGTNQFYFDAANGRFGVNASGSPTTTLHVVGKCAADTVKFESSTACVTGVGLTLYHSPPAGSNVGDFPATINLAGRNSNAQQVNFARIRSRILGTGINATSGEFFVDVDYTGVPTTVMVANPFHTLIGLSSSGNYRNNIVVGNFSSDSGNADVILGHYSSVQQSSSSGNVILGHYSSGVGTSVIVGGNNSYASGNDVFSLGNRSSNTGSGLLNLGRNTLVGTGLISVGQSNIASVTNNSVIFGNNNTVTSGTSGLLIGFNNNVTYNNTVFGLSNTVSGYSNLSFGTNVSANGSGNTIVGNSATVIGSGNFVLGSNNSVVGNSGFIIGNNLSTTNTSSGILLGINNVGIALSSSGLVINAGRNSSFTTSILGSASNSGLFVSGNNVGLNNPNPAYTLDVSGTTRTSGLYANSFRLSSGTIINNSFLLTDTSGNASWVAPSAVKSIMISGLNNGQVVYYNGSDLVSATGLYFSATSGLYITPSGSSNNINFAHVVIPTGGTPVIINNDNQPISNAFSVQGSGLQENLITADAANNFVGINSVPAYPLDVSGSFRSISDSLNYTLRTNNSFLISYDESVGVKRRFEISNTGIYINQATTGLVPKVTYTGPQQSSGYLADVVSNLNSPTINSINIKLLTWDNSDNRIRYADDIYGGFGQFNGSTDS
jgi:hypothetical protein